MTSIKAKCKALFKGKSRRTVGIVSKLPNEEQLNRQEDPHATRTDIRSTYEAQLNRLNLHEQTPLHMAAMRGDTDVVKLFMAKGADVTVKDRFGKIPLHLAIGNGRHESVKMLLDSNCVHERLPVSNSG